MRLIYDGILSSEEAIACEAMTKNYGYAIELSRLPDNGALDHILKRRTWQHTGDSGCGDYTYERSGILYALVQKNFLNGPRDSQGKFLGGAILFVKDAEDHASVVANLSDIVVSDSPFKTALEVRS
jgi:hypothetical protein